MIIFNTLKRVVLQNYLSSHVVEETELLPHLLRHVCRFCLVSRHIRSLSFDLLYDLLNNGDLLLPPYLCEEYPLFFSNFSPSKIDLSMNDEESLNHLNLDVIQSLSISTQADDYSEESIAKFLDEYNFPNLKDIRFTGFFDAHFLNNKSLFQNIKELRITEIHLNNESFIFPIFPPSLSSVEFSISSAFSPTITCDVSTLQSIISIKLINFESDYELIVIGLGKLSKLKEIHIQAVDSVGALHEDCKPCTVTFQELSSDALRILLADFRNFKETKFHIYDCELSDVLLLTPNFCTNISTFHYEDPSYIQTNSIVNLPNLKSATFEYYNFSSTLFNLTSNFLESLSINRCSSKCFQIPYNLNLANLTLYNIDATDLFNFIEKCPLLRQLDVANISNLIDFPKLPINHFENLVECNISYSAAFFEFFDFPKLKSLSAMKFPKFDWSWLVNKFPKLTNLHLEDTLISPPFCNSLLTNLEINNCLYTCLNFSPFMNLISLSITQSKRVELPRTMMIFPFKLMNLNINAPLEFFKRIDQVPRYFKGNCCFVTSNEAKESDEIVEILREKFAENISNIKISRIMGRHL
ncbi:hypothetical protein RCL1_007764 [Eukaryota sp. TZLM3-RCL]